MILFHVSIDEQLKNRTCKKIFVLSSLFYTFPLPKSNTKPEVKDKT